jgi:AAA+ ATPase superfamily predicted ATPase
MEILSVITIELRFSLTFLTKNISSENTKGKFFVKTMNDLKQLFFFQKKILKFVFAYK